MVRFWPTAGIVCLLAGFLGLVALGFWSAMRGELIEVQGQWLGPVPLDGADDCRIRIWPTDAFDLDCKGQTKYAAQGTWRRYQNNLEMTFSWLTRDGQKTKTPVPWVLRTDGGHNTLFVGPAEQRGEPYCWRRAAP